MERRYGERNLHMSVFTNVSSPSKTKSELRLWLKLHNMLQDSLQKKKKITKNIRELYFTKEYCLLASKIFIVHINNYY